MTTPPPRPEALLPRYFTIWAALNALFGVALFGWAALVPAQGGPLALTIFVLIGLYFVALGFLLWWWFRQRPGRAGSREAWVIAAVSAALPWPLTLMLTSQWLAAQGGMLRGLGFLVGGLLSAAGLVWAASVARRRG